MRTERLDGRMELLAKEIHCAYCKNHPGAAYDMPWEDLPEDIRQANRDQAGEFVGHLESLGLTVGLADQGASRLWQLSGDQVESIAIRIHEVWLQSKKAAGWTYGTPRDDVLRRHPMMAPYSDLPEKEKEKDREIARNMVPQLASVGLGVYPAV